MVVWEPSHPSRMAHSKKAPHLAPDRIRWQAANTVVANNRKSRAAPRRLGQAGPPPGAAATWRALPKERRAGSHGFPYCLPASGPSKGRQNPGPLTPCLVTKADGALVRMRGSVTRRQCQVPEVLQVLKPVDISGRFLRGRAACQPVTVFSLDPLCQKLSVG